MFCWFPHESYQYKLFPEHFCWEFEVQVLPEQLPAIHVWLPVQVVCS
jgi:hypothetical protein